MNLKPSILCILFCTAALLQFSCKKDPIAPLPAEITLSAEDIGVSDVLLSVKTLNVSLPQNLTLQRNNTPLSSFTLTTNDTVIIDTTAEPKHTYTYKVILGSGDAADIQVTTLDTTSHDFTWERFYFGGHSGEGKRAQRCRNHQRYARLCGWSGQPQGLYRQCAFV